MKCEICGNDYPSQYYFTTPTVCTNCFDKLEPEQKEMFYSAISKGELTGMGKELFLRIGFGKRFGAYFLDIVINLIVLVTAMVFTGDFDWMKENIAGLQDVRIMSEFIERISSLSIIITPIYWSLEIFLAASPGKILLGLQIANDDRTFASISTLFIRFAIKHVDYLFSLAVFLTAVELLSHIGSALGFIIIIGFFFTLGERRQGFHDMLSRTAVYNKNDISNESSTII